MSKSTENKQKALQLPSKSGSEQVNRIQRDFNRLTNKIIEKCLDALRAEYNKNAALDQKINKLFELCKEFGEELSTFRSKKLVKKKTNILQT
ncbi:21099_t:CDS:2 [Racocetra persica]|uniref:21099_t:CDS:1 n=1 Tax=Racocetra persica TaxID=160502 RepID=A0ACA9QZH5_9GLOM|nr:21099_t:CDS:2 [Racocetra persica]